MKLYKINVNGKSYEVEVETISEQKVIKTQPKKEMPVNESTTNVLAPMQGTITKLNIKVGNVIKKGDVLMVLEAMKLENDILSPVDGYVRQLLVKENEKVDINQLMLIIG